MGDRSFPRKRHVPVVKRSIPSDIAFRYEVYLTVAVSKAVRAIPKEEYDKLRREEKEKLIKVHPDFSDKNWNSGLFKSWLDACVKKRVRTRLNLLSLEDWAKEEGIKLESDEFEDIEEPIETNQEHRNYSQPQNRPPAQPYKQHTPYQRSPMQESRSPYTASSESTDSSDKTTEFKRPERTVTPPPPPTEIKPQPTPQREEKQPPAPVKQEVRVSPVVAKPEEKAQPPKVEPKVVPPILKTIAEKKATQVSTPPIEVKPLTPPISKPPVESKPAVSPAPVAAPEPLKEKPIEKPTVISTPVVEKKPIIVAPPEKTPPPPPVVPEKKPVIAPAPEKKPVTPPTPEKKPVTIPPPEKKPVEVKPAPAIPLVSKVTSEKQTDDKVPDGLIRDKVIFLLKKNPEGLSVGEIADALVKPRQSIIKPIHHLLDMGLIEKAGERWKAKD